MAKVGNFWGPGGRVSLALPWKGPLSRNVRLILDLGSHKQTESLILEVKQVEIEPLEVYKMETVTMPISEQSISHHPKVKHTLRVAQILFGSLVFSGVLIWYVIKIPATPLSEFFLLFAGMLAVVSLIFPIFILKASRMGFPKRDDPQFAQRFSQTFFTTFLIRLALADGALMMAIFGLGDTTDPETRLSVLIAYLALMALLFPRSSTMTHFFRQVMAGKRD